MDIPSALSAILAAKDALSAIVETRDAMKLVNLRASADQALAQATERTIAVQQLVASLATRVNELEKENVHLRDWTDERANYDLEQVGEGVFVYTRKESNGPAQEKHKLCCGCFDRTIKATLQQRAISTENIGLRIALTCPNGCPDLMFTHYIGQ